jgi:hypothetical protein
MPSLRGAVVVINPIFGWTVLGWCVALLIALWTEKPERQPWMPPPYPIRRSRHGRLNHRCGMPTSERHHLTATRYPTRSKHPRTSRPTASSRSVAAGTHVDVLKRRTRPDRIDSV